MNVREFHNGKIVNPADSSKSNSNLVDLHHQGNQIQINNKEQEHNNKMALQGVKRPRVDSFVNGVPLIQQFLAKGPVMVEGSSPPNKNNVPAHERYTVFAGTKELIEKT